LLGEVSPRIILNKVLFPDPLPPLIWRPEPAFNENVRL